MIRLAFADRPLKTIDGISFLTELNGHGRSRKKEGTSVSQVSLDLCCSYVRLSLSQPKIRTNRINLSI